MMVQPIFVLVPGLTVRQYLFRSRRAKAFKYIQRAEKLKAQGKHYNGGLSGDQRNERERYYDGMADRYIRRSRAS